MELIKMTKLNQKERMAFMDIIRTDITAINLKIHEQLKDIWEQARNEILHDCGQDVLIQRKKEIDSEIEKLREEKHRLEKELKKEPLTVSQALEFGGTLNDWGEARNAHFYGIPVNSQIDYKIIKLIQQNIDVEAPAKYLDVLARSALREIAMAGTFEDAKEVYEQFYSLDFRKYGVDIPPRLKDMKKERPTLAEPKRLMLSQPERDEKIDVS